MIVDTVINPCYVPGFVFTKKVFDLHGSFRYTTKNMMSDGTVIFEETGENVIPYFNTGLYINLDTLNIISKGKKNDYNIVVFSLKLMMEASGIICDRNNILLALERNILGYPVQECFSSEMSVGSMISSTISSVISNQDLVEFFYFDIKKLADSLVMSDVLLDRSLLTSKFKWVVGVLKILRTIGKDYVLRSCIEVPGFIDRVLNNVLGSDYTGRVQKELEDKMGLGVFDLESGNEEREFFEGFIDLYRLSCKIKSIKEGS